MYAQSIFVPHDRVFIMSGPLHGFAATVLDVPRPGKLQLTIDGFNERSRFIVADTDVEPCKEGEQPSDQMP